MAYSSWSVVFGEQPSASKWNILGTNDASFNDGTGIGNATITANKLALSPAEDYVATIETTTSTSFVDLATVGPDVTVTIGANGLALVSIYCRSLNTASTGQALMGIDVSGANTIAADSTRIIGQVFTGNYELWCGASFLYTGLNAGSTTFTAKYKRLTAGTASFSTRRIAVIPL